MGAAVRVILIVAVVTLVVGVPFLDARVEYAHHKRLREVEPGKLYRSGQLTVEGFRDAVTRLGIRTIVNCQNELPGEDVFADPRVALSFWDRHTIRESALCTDLGVKYLHLEPDLCSNRADPHARPKVIGEFLKIMDERQNWPVLLHCKAGLHRTGVLAAVYRMEYQDWDATAAIAELKAHGFGDVACTAANDYIQQYVLDYRPRKREP
jgi:protein tyrosine/serine phosphatase